VIEWSVERTQTDRQTDAPRITHYLHYSLRLLGGDNYLVVLENKSNGGYSHEFDVA